MCLMEMRVLGYIRAFWVGWRSDAGVEDLGGCMFFETGTFMRPVRIDQGVEASASWQTNRCCLYNVAFL